VKNKVVVSLVLLAMGLAVTFVVTAVSVAGTAPN
jgi:hypothetical protein